MCYFLYGAINDGINLSDYQSVINHSDVHFNVGNQDDVNACVVECGDVYRITENYCECDTPIGGKQISKKALRDIKDYLMNLKNIRGINHVLISKNWWKQSNEDEVTIHIDDVDVIHFLANIKDNTLYKIELYKRYYNNNKESK